jgi:2-isopropylmalate synthase
MHQTITGLYYLEELSRVKAGSDKVTIFDTTLRDGEQTPGVSLTVSQKLEIARQLSKLGVDIIEAGFPISSAADKEAVKRIASEGLDPVICGLARASKNDIDACLDAEVAMVHTFIPTSAVQREYTIKKSQEEVIQAALEAVDYIKAHGARCMFSAMDATRTEMDYLIQIYKAVRDAGCEIINVPDTVGIMVPSVMQRFVKDIALGVEGIKVDVHCHNDFGLAVANTLAGVEAGATQVQVTVNGIGERAGNADLAQTVMALTSIYGKKTGIRTEYLLETSKLVENYTKIRLTPNTPVIGQNAFSHESGIHSHGVLEKTDTFEPGIMTPEMVGHKRRIVIGKHTGKHAVRQSLESAGILVNERQLDEIVKRIKEIAEKGKQITDADLNAVASVVLGKPSGEEWIRLKEVSVMTGNVLTPTAVIKATVGGKEVIAASPGAGPVDAVLNALKISLGPNNGYQLEEFRIDAITGGSDALADVYIGMKKGDDRVITARAANPDIVMASVEAFVGAVNLYHEKQLSEGK